MKRKNWAVIAFFIDEGKAHQFAPDDCHGFNKMGMMPVMPVDDPIHTLIKNEVIIATHEETGSLVNSIYGTSK
jgi:hypothetical protein